MDETQADITSSAEAIEAAFGGRWGVWLSDTGWWWAARCDPLNASALGAGCVPFLRAQTPALLAERIQDQEALHMRTAGTAQTGQRQTSSPRTRATDSKRNSADQQKETTRGNGRLAAQTHSDRSAPADSVAPRFDPGVPHPARIYAYWLGSKDHYPCDRKAAEEVAAQRPQVVAGARANRAFLARVVRYLAGQGGVRQFLDIGPGLPAALATHEVAQAIAPDSKIVYVDNDPLVMVHARALLTGKTGGTCDHVDGDLRDPESIMREAAKTLDFARPAAVILVAVLHFLADADDPAGVVAALADVLAPGSFVAISHLTSDFAPDQVRAGVAAYNAMVPVGLTARTHHEVTGLFGGLALVAPGVVPVSEWRPENAPVRGVSADMYAGLATTRRSLVTSVKSSGGRA
jgi:SAM-dependent methyltransferase